MVLLVMPAGAEGGEIIAEGTPEELSFSDGSYTGKFLKKILKANLVKNLS